VSLPRLRLEKSDFKGGIWCIQRDEARHLVTVRRCRTGSLAEGLLGGERIRLELRCDGDSVTAVEVSREEEPPMYPEVHLLLALLKSDQFDSSLRFAAEIGVTEIHLLECERSVPKYSRERAAGKLARWRRILDEATKQAGSARAPLLKAPERLDKLDFTELPEAKYAALLSGVSVPISQIEIKYPAVVAIGPEGDWSPDETSLLLERGFQAVSLSERILRASTAVAVACSWMVLSARNVAVSHQG